ncbi:MAG: DUF4129 domain-containing protein [Planctomycetaceae bacterium]|nr:DUF4129 domain-containing protein [Planctomycetaceae bacterium]
MSPSLKILQQTVSLLFVVCVAVPAVAQERRTADDPRLNRILELPPQNNGGVIQQLEQLKQLQQMLHSLQSSSESQADSNSAAPGGQANSSDQSNSTDSQSNPAGQSLISKMLGDAMKQFGGQLPPGFSPDSIPPELIGRLMADPEARQQIQKLLEQYAKTRQLPQGGPGNGRGLLPPDPNATKSQTENNNRAPTENRSAPSSATSGTGSALPEEQDTDEQPAAREGSAETSSDPAAKSETPEDSSTPDRPKQQSWSERLRGMVDRFSGKSSTANQNSPGNSAPTPSNPNGSSDDGGTGNSSRTSPNFDSARRSSSSEGQQRTNNRANDSRSTGERTAQPSATDSNSRSLPNSDQRTMPQSDSDWQAMLERMIQQQRNGARRAKEGTLGQNSDSSHDTGDIVPSNSDSAPGTLPSNIDPKTLEQLARRFQELFPDGIPQPNSGSDSQQPGRRTGSAPSTAQSRDGSTGSRQGSLGGGEPLNNRRDGRSNVDGTPRNTAEDVASREAAAEKARLQEKAMSTLQQRGLAETLRQIVRDTRQEVQQESRGRAADSSSNAEQPSEFGNSLASALDGIRKDLIEIAKDANFTAPSPSSPSSGNQSRGGSGGRNKSTIHEWSESVTDFLSDTVPSPPQSPNDSGTSQATPQLDTGSLSSGAASAVAVMVVIFLAGLFLAWKTGLLPSREDRARANIRAMLEEGGVRSRGDVVRAFHGLALDPKCAAERWWTHRRVADRIRSSTPARSDAVATLTELYEEARYLPDDAEFTESQLQRARQALEQCVL